MFKNIDINDDNLKEIGIDKLVQEAVKVKYENNELKILQTIIKEQQLELETYKKVAEKLAEKLTYERGRKQDYMFCIDICEENWCDNKNCNQCMENIIEWARKEVEK